MEPLWRYEDFVEQLSHPNPLVRRRALDFLNYRYRYRYADAVAGLIDDPDTYLASAAYRYLARHEATAHAPAILERFESEEDGSRRLPRQAQTLGIMKYEPALPAVLRRLKKKPDPVFLESGIYYLSKIRSEEGHLFLKNLFRAVKDPSYLEPVAGGLLAHLDPEDIPDILNRQIRETKLEKSHGDGLRKTIAFELSGGEGYWRELKNMKRHPQLGAPDEVMMRCGEYFPGLEDAEDLLWEIGDALLDKDYPEVVDRVVNDSRSVFQARYPDDPPAWLTEIFELDRLALTVLEEVKRRPRIWKNVNAKEADLWIHMVLCAFFSIRGRAAYPAALDPAADPETLIEAVRHADEVLPVSIQDRIVELAPVQALPTVLTPELCHWCDVWAVHLMGRIGDPAFVPELIRVLREVDSLDFIHKDTIEALAALDESADAAKLAAIQEKAVTGWKMFHLAEYLPYPQSHDALVREWRESAEMDSYSFYVESLVHIGDPRAVDELRRVYHEEEDAVFVGEALECLSDLHQTDIPEMEEILTKREAEARELKERGSMLDQMFQGGVAPPLPAKKPETVVREGPKVGRNDPCPCGSGKKYKKCCLNK
ncbi:MAG: HEAT repeat domain-containing protein [Thermodesulfobacteriota bacterium]